MEGWQILDAVFIANEVIDSKLMSRRGEVVCKLDIEKAYDYVNWTSLLEVIRKIDFG